jgi:hypothetical protein
MAGLELTVRNTANIALANNTAKTFLQIVAPSNVGLEVEEASFSVTGTDATLPQVDVDLHHGATATPANASKIGDKINKLNPGDGDTLASICDTTNADTATLVRAYENYTSEPAGTKTSPFGEVLRQGSVYTWRPAGGKLRIPPGGTFSLRATPGTSAPSVRGRIQFRV